MGNSPIKGNFTNSLQAKNKTINISAGAWFGQADIVTDPLAYKEKRVQLHLGLNS